MDRRDFIRTACVACAGTIGGSGFLASCSSTKAASAFHQNGNTITLKKTEFTVVKKEKTLQRKFVSIKPEGLLFPIAVYKLADGSFAAVFLQCSHQGCELTPYETTMVCPCHGAEFNNTGLVTQGPAEANLKTFTTSHDHENIYIQL